MVLVTQQLQGSYVAFPSRRLSRSRALTLKRSVSTVQLVGRTDRGISLKRSISLSVGAPFTRGSKVKHFKVLAFKWSAQNGESGGRAGESNVPKNSVKLSYVPEESEETIIEASKAHIGPVAYASDTNERIAGSAAIQKLFQKWLRILLSQSPTQVVDGILGEEPPPRDSSETCIETQSNRRSGILSTVWHQFWSLDAAAKIPLLIFIPWYLAVNAIYGAEVSKELTPLWIFGPLIVALYIKMLRGLCALYVFSFKQTVKIIRNLPTYYLVASNYVVRGKLKEDLRARIWQPLIDMKNMDYKEVSKRKMKEFQEWMMEKYLDFVESIWPYYCRTIRFLKRANLI